LESEHTKVANVMRAYAEHAVEYAKTRYGIDLDYSEASLAEVDRMMDDRTRGTVIEVDQLTFDEREELWIYCKMIGGYVGEVVIRNLGGTWQAKQIDSGSLAVKLMVGGEIEASPPDAVWRTLTEPFRSMASYYRGVRAILGRAAKPLEGSNEAERGGD